MKTKILAVVRNVLYLKGITWNSSKEGWEQPPVTQTGTCGKITHLSNVKKQLLWSICLNLLELIWSWLTWLISISYFKSNANNQPEALSDRKNGCQLTNGSLYKLAILEMAIVRVEEVSPTIPSTGGFPLQLSFNWNGSPLPLVIDRAARNEIPRLPQLLWRWYPKDILGSSLGFLLISLTAKAIVWARLNASGAKLKKINNNN